MDWIALVQIVSKAAAIVLLVKIALSDLRIQKIRNSDLLVLLALALTVLTLAFVRSQELRPVLIAFAMAAIMFLVLLGFWLFGKVGAGDVKLLGIVPLLVGAAGSGPFVVALLLFSVLAAVVMKFPVLLPERMFRSYVEGLSRTGRVPFGVPISLAAILGLLFAG